MKKILCFIAGCLVATVIFAANKPVTVKSPDGRIAVKIENFKYSIQVDGVQMIAPSSISMTLEDGTVYGDDAKMMKASFSKVDQTLSAFCYKKREVKDYCNQVTMCYKKFDLIFRVYDEGVAYRFVSKSAEPFGVKSEEASFSLPDNWTLYAAYCNKKAEDLEKQSCCSYENTYTVAPVKEWDKARTAFLPLLVEAPGGYKMVITESDLFDFPGLELYNGDESTTLQGFHTRVPKDVAPGGHNNVDGIVQSRYDLIAKDCKPGAALPWRIIQISREDKELANSDMVWKLASAASAQTDWSWVKPGKVAWDWWNDWNIRGVDFKAGVNTSTYKYYIDFASANGIEYVILDEGWSVKGKGDLLAVVPEIDLKEIVQYGNQKNVGIILWAGYWPMNKDIEGNFRHYSEMGVKGFKIDFMDRDDQVVVNFYTACAQMGQKYRMLVDFHGAYKPTGLQRTYPNVLNFEGVHGLEQMKWEKSTKQVIYDVCIPFIRMVAGPFDYTQGAMRNATKACYYPCNSEPMSLGTRCRQLAEYVVFESPLNMLCDSPSNYMKEPECTGFISLIPTVWDETIALDGKLGEFVTIARRSADTWYIGSITNWDERDMTINFSFLPEGRYKVEIFKDGVNAHRCAADYAKEEITVSPSDKITAHLAPGGGWVARVMRE